MTNRLKIRIGLLLGYIAAVTSIVLRRTAPPSRRCCWPHCCERQ
jgi:hypothetical protein